MATCYMSVEEKHKRDLRIVELRDEYELKFGEIGTRLGMHESRASTIYKRMKKGRSK